MNRLARRFGSWDGNSQNWVQIVRFAQPKRERPCPVLNAAKPYESQKDEEILSKCFLNHFERPLKEFLEAHNDQTPLGTAGEWRFICRTDSATFGGSKCKVR